ncbi:MAG: hypothetical protein JWN02_1982, partial [Acidobacteria bacterium]|nr:hypothetical protein [Acidobacteriota bacterium]
MIRNQLAVLLGTVLVVGAFSAAAQTTFVSDTFTVGANTMLEAHSPNVGGAWTRYVGGSGITLNAAADNARNVATGDWNVYGNATSAPNAEHVVGATVTFAAASANNFLELYGRGSASLLNGYAIRFASSGAISMVRYVGGAATTVASGTVTVALNSPITVVFSLKNASKQLWINGVQVLTSADNTVATTGIVALAMQSNGANQVIVDNFFASTFAPTAVDRLDADAVSDGARTLVEWSTVREAHNLGFRLYREEGGRRVPLSSSPVAGAAFSVAGAARPGNAYRWLDPAASLPGAVYWIEELDLRGSSSWHGPIAARRGTVDAAAVSSLSLAEAGKSDPRAQHDGVVARPALAATVAAETTAANGRRRIADKATDAVLQQWSLAASNAIKIGVREEGIYRLTGQELLTAGIDPSVDPRTLRLYADGSEVPMAIAGEADGRLDAGDRILFYGRPLASLGSDTRIYWLLAAAGQGARLVSLPSAAAAPLIATGFTAIAERRDKTLFFAALRNGENESFFGPALSSDPAQPTTQLLHLQHLDRTASSARVTVTLQGGNEEGAHHPQVSLNGQALGSLTYEASNVGTASFDIPAVQLVEGDNTIAILGEAGDAAAVVSVSLRYEHTFQADDDRLLAAVEGGRQVSLSGFSSGEVELFDVTGATPVRMTPLTSEGGKVTFTAPGSGVRTILAVGASRFSHPVSMVKNEPSSLHDATGADVVIISHPDFASAADPLVQLRQAQGLSVAVVKTDDIYDEFSFGAKEGEAIRAFLAYAAGHWATPPRYVLLLGDASFDEKNYLGLGDFDFVPTHLVVADLLKTASDSWLADFDNDGVADIPIGRLPVRTLGDARIEVAKIVKYEAGVGTVADRSVLFVSDADAALDFHASAVDLRQSLPADFRVVDVNLSESGVAAAREELLSSFPSAMLVDYLGHGSVESWSNDRLLGR